MRWHRDPYKNQTPGLNVQPKNAPPPPPPAPRPEPTPEQPRALGPSGISDLPPALGYNRPDPTQAPPRDETPAPAIPTPPHCNATHGPGACMWCDALTGLATALRHQENEQRRLDARQQDQNARLARVEAHLGLNERGDQ